MACQALFSPASPLLHPPPPPRSGAPLAALLQVLLPDLTAAPAPIPGSLSTRPGSSSQAPSAKVTPLPLRPQLEDASLTRRSPGTCSRRSTMGLRWPRHSCKFPSVALVTGLMSVCQIGYELREGGMSFAFLPSVCPVPNTNQISGIYAESINQSISESRDLPN